MLPRKLRALALVTVLGFGQADAATLVLNFNSAFSGVPPLGTGAWLTTTLTDVSDGVRLDVRADGLVAPEALRSVYLNLDPVLIPGTVNFTWLGGRSATIERGSNSFKADGDGRYDFLLEFSTGARAFGPGEFSSYRLSGPASLSALSFNFLSQPAGGHGPFRAAAHVQGTGGGADSGWVAGIVDGGGGPAVVPLPPAVLLLGSALLTFAAGARRASRAPWRGHLSTV